MKIEYKQVPELLSIFKSYWSAKYHIRFKWELANVQAEKDKLDTKQIFVINVRVNDTDLGGEGEENWTLEYAYELLKKPKEMELCIKRWQQAFKGAKKKATLDILGQKVDESTLH